MYPGSSLTFNLSVMNSLALYVKRTITLYSFLLQFNLHAEECCRALMLRLTEAACGVNDKLHLYMYCILIVYYICLNTCCMRVWFGGQCCCTTKHSTSLLSYHWYG